MQNLMGLNNDGTNPHSLFLAPLTTLKSDGEVTIYGRASHQKTLSTYHVEEGRLKPNMGRHNLTSKRVITHNPQNHLSKYSSLFVGHIIWLVGLIFAINTKIIHCNLHIQLIEQTFFFHFYLFTFLQLYLF
jgi:hypothetical protein